MSGKIEMKINEGSTGIEVTLPNGAFYEGTWYVIGKSIQHGQELFLLEHEELGDTHPCVIVDRNNNVILENVWNGFEDYRERIVYKVNRYDLPIPIEFRNNKNHVTLTHQYKLPYDLAFVDENGYKYEIYQGIINSGDLHIVLRDVLSGKCIFSEKLDKEFDEGRLELAEANLSNYAYEILACGQDLVDFRYRETVHTIAQEIGKYESEAKVPNEERVTAGAGDYALYEFKDGVSEELVQNAYLNALIFQERKRVEEHSQQEAAQKAETLSPKPIRRPKSR